MCLPEFSYFSRGMPDVERLTGTPHSHIQTCWRGSRSWYSSSLLVFRNLRKDFPGHHNQIIGTIFTSANNLDIRDQSWLWTSLFILVLTSLWKILRSNPCRGSNISSLACFKQVCLRKDLRRNSWRDFKISLDCSNEICLWKDFWRNLCRGSNVSVACLKPKTKMVAL